MHTITMAHDTYKGSQFTIFTASAAAEARSQVRKSFQGNMCPLTRVKPSAKVYRRTKKVPNEV